MLYNSIIGIYIIGLNVPTKMSMLHTSKCNGISLLVHVWGKL